MGNSPSGLAFTARNGGAQIMAELKKGDHVSWDTPQGETEGTVVRKQTTPTKIKSHAVKASKDNPQFIVKSDKTGAQAAHKPDALRKG